MTQSRFVKDVISLDEFSCKLTIIVNLNRIAI
ncbi:Uncharacterised protein [Legionella pneumophila]|nr:Uncharacterised protein [Legionella pneumophila]CZG56274.1 Uncharacterised protein [Legionella pneumophila]CZG57593.1 Uncharacterised protein [Legionella pneumophila]CZG64619.1 Uncharacterised protein [Legionella pneumophila]CZG65290.1 Uncharacterised protein [Legionella pneumophila]